MVMTTSFSFDFVSLAIAFASRSDMVQVANDRWLDSDAFEGVFGAIRKLARWVRQILRNALSDFRDRFADIGPRLIIFPLLVEELVVGIADQLEEFGRAAVPGFRGGQLHRFRIGEVANMIGSAAMPRRRRCQRGAS